MRDPPWLWLEHYPQMLRAYWHRGEDGLAEMAAELRTRAAEQPGGKFSKRQAAYTPIVPLPPLDWRHECGHCRFWVDEGPGKPGECMIVGREGDPFGGTAIHEKAGCALFMPPAGEPAFDWVREQLRPSGADLVRGEYHPPGDGSGRARRRPTERTVGGAYAPAGPTVGLELVADGLTAPVAFVADPRDDERQFVADQSGQLYLLDDGREELLDLREELVELRTQYDERGLLGLALHPEFAENGRLFVRYSAPPREGTPDGHDHAEVLSEFRLENGSVDPATERTVLELPSPQFNHNAGAIEFGPDGYLYVATGDGGSEGDTGPGHVPGGNAQDVTENLLGGILRIDVDGRDADRPYGIPADNPLVGEEGREEYYAWGLRNPWRMSFDSGGRLFVADVGQALFEEVNLVERGGNYGWNVREGFHCFDPESPSDPPDDCPAETERGEPLLDPIFEYPHVHGDEVVGSAIVGGHVYEGDELPELRGSYVFGDWATSQDEPSGRLFVADPDGGNLDAGPGEWSLSEVVVAGSATGRFDRTVLGFGLDSAGELCVLSSETHVPKGKTGAVHRLVPP